MALSQTPSQNTTSPPAAAATAGPGDTALKLDGLYSSASNLETELEASVRHNTVSLTPGQVGGFNAVLKMARELLPESLALREDLDEIDETARPIDVHQALHITIVPTLHNALPEPLYDQHG